ncbi:uncharacterized protein V6R79_025326 [Siganus canaliculatus]
MRGYRKKRLCSGNGQPSPFRSVIRPVDSFGRGLVSGTAVDRCGPPWPTLKLGVLVSSWMPKGRSCSSGSSSCLRPQRLLNEIHEPPFDPASPPRTIAPSDERQVKQPTGSVTGETRDSNAGGQGAPVIQAAVLPGLEGEAKAIAPST